MRLYTVYQRRKGLAEKRNIPLLDVSTYSGHADLVPCKSQVYLLKNGNITDEEFVRRYREKLLTHYKQTPTFWKELASNKALAIYDERTSGLLANRFYVRDMIIAARKDMDLTFEVMGMEIYASRDRDAYGIHTEEKPPLLDLSKIKPNSRSGKFDSFYR